MSINPANIGALAAMLNLSGTTAPAPTGELEKSIDWANVGMDLPFRDPISGETTNEFFAFFGAAFDKLKHRKTPTGQPKSKEGHLLHARVRVQNAMQDQIKAGFAELKPGETKRLEYTFVVVLQKAGAEPVSQPVDTTIVQLPNLLAVVPPAS